MNDRLLHKYSKILDQLPLRLLIYKLIKLIKMYLIAYLFLTENSQKILKFKRLIMSYKVIHKKCMK